MERSPNRNYTGYTITDPCSAVCGKSVDSTTMAEHEGEAYCKSCHAKQFGPKGYGYSGGGAMMHVRMIYNAC